MIKIIVLAYLLSIYLSLPGLFSKAGYNALLGLIPIYNVYLLVQILEISPILLILLSLGLIFLPDRVFIGTLMAIFLPVIISDAYDKPIIYGLFSIILPFILIPIAAYINGTYRYDMED